MKNVKRVFFITEAEAKSLSEALKDPYITFTMPCYELEDGKVMYPQMGGPAAFERYYREA